MPRVEYKEKFDDNVLDIQIIPGFDSDKSKLNFTWKCISITEQTMQIQLTFKDPLFISFKVNYDHFSALIVKRQAKHSL